MIADLAKIKSINQTRLENALSRVVNPPIFGIMVNCDIL
jgi:hypothetical protein